MHRANNPQAVKPIKFRNRDQAESQVCQAIAALGRLAGIDVDKGDGPDDIDAELIEAAYQSNFDDPHFLGGPCCFNYAGTTADVDILKAKADAVTRGLVDYISKRVDKKTLQQAEEHAATVDSAFAWLSRTVRSP